MYHFECLETLGNVVYAEVTKKSVGMVTQWRPCYNEETISMIKFFRSSQVLFCQHVCMAMCVDDVYDRVHV